MDQKRIIIGLIGLAMLLPQILGCMIGAPCERLEPGVYLATDVSQEGFAPLSVAVYAEAGGRHDTCGSDSEFNTEIVEYRWDFDGDGAFESVGPSPRFAGVFSEPGSHTVTVEVVDELGNTAQDAIVFEVLEPFDSAAFLDGASVELLRPSVGDGDCALDRQVCIEIIADRDAPIDVLLSITQADDSWNREWVDGLRRNTSGFAVACILASRAAGTLEVAMTSGDASRIAELSVEELPIPTSCE